MTDTTKPSLSNADTNIPYTSISSIASLISQAHETSASRLTHPHHFRLAQLRGIERLLLENWDALADALSKDLGQGPMYCEVFELNGVVGRLRYTMKHLKHWMKTKHKPTPFPLNLTVPVHSELTPYPRGVALIISPWNFPIQLPIGNLVDALAAGNVCILKQSEKSVHVTSLLTELLTNGKYVDNRAVIVVNGGADVASELLKHRIDVISYTGGGEVGKIVALAAAKHLTPVMLELGGKCPVFVTKHADIPSAALRVAWGKIAGNAGQFCISPDYVVIDESVKEQFTNHLFAAWDRMYPMSSYTQQNETKKFGDVGTMISVEHAQRVVSLVDSSCKVIYGGKHHNVQEKFVAPTIVEATAESTIMKHEIFGPMLAIVTVSNLDEGIEFVRQNFSSKGEHPLALYIFSKCKKEQKQIMDTIPSGGCGVNDLLKHGGNYHLPFGGVGASGMGCWYGKHGFDFYSHYRGALIGGNFTTSPNDPGLWMTLAPHNEKKLKAFRMISKLPTLIEKFPSARSLKKMVFVLGIGYLYTYQPSVFDAILELNIKTVFEWFKRMMTPN